MFRIEIKAELRPTEDVDKVLKAIKNIFGIDKYEVKEEGLYSVIKASSSDIRSLLKFHEILRQSRILDTARKILSSGRRGEEIIFKLHKQSAYAGKISFVTFESESPMGPIEVRIVTDNPEKIIDWLAPKTSKGKPLWNYSIPEV